MLRRTIPLLITIFSVSFISCTSEVARPQTTINMEPFIAMAKKATVCAEQTNKLFAIDDSLVFWQREGYCNDAAYEYTLFGIDTTIVYCQKHDSFAGEMIKVRDSFYLPLFNIITSIDTLTGRLPTDKPDLGLVRIHSVIQVIF
jgi:hypothetical protein